MNIRGLLKGTEYEGKSDKIAAIIEKNGLASEAGIHDIPRLGHIAGVDIYALLQTILKQKNAPETAVEEVTSENVTPEPAPKPKARPKRKRTVAAKTNSGRKTAGKRARGEQL